MSFYNDIQQCITNITNTSEYFVIATLYLYQILHYFTILGQELWTTDSNIDKESIFKLPSPCNLFLFFPEVPSFISPSWRFTIQPSYSS